jgi:hypothetical protein
MAFYRFSVFLLQKFLPCFESLMVADLLFASVQ